MTVLSPATENPSESGYNPPEGSRLFTVQIPASIPVGPMHLSLPPKDGGWEYLGNLNHALKAVLDDDPCEDGDDLLLRCLSILNMVKDQVPNALTFPIVNGEAWISLNEATLSINRAWACRHSGGCGCAGGCRCF